MNPLLLLASVGALAWWALSQKSATVPAAPPGAPPVDVVGPPPTVVPVQTGGVAPMTNTQISTFSVGAGTQAVRWYGGRPWRWTPSGWQRLY